MHYVTHAGSQHNLRHEVGAVENCQVRPHAAHSPIGRIRSFVCPIDVAEEDLFQNRKRNCSLELKISETSKNRNISIYSLLHLKCMYNH